jgi:hypothetical protein
MEQTVQVCWIHSGRLGPRKRELDASIDLQPCQAVSKFRYWRDESKAMGVSGREIGSFPEYSWKLEDMEG